VRILPDVYLIFVTSFAGLIPREDLASDHVLNMLMPFAKENGGPLEIEVFCSHLSVLY
jgi:hypothetical protein